MNKINTLKKSLTTALVLVGLSTVLALFCLNKYISDSKEVDKLNTEVALLNKIKYTSRDAVAKVRGFLLVPHPDFIRDFEVSFTNVSQSFSQLKTSFNGEKAKLQHLEKVKASVLKRYHNLELLLVAHKLGDNERIKALTLEVLGESNKLNQLTNLLEAQNNQSLKKIRASQRVFRTITLIVSLLSYGLSFSFLYFSLKGYQRAEREKEAAYAALNSKNRELANLNNSLDAKVRQRTLELEEKNRELNLYAEQLKNSFEDLEVKVKFRTLELEKNIKNLQLENAALKEKNVN